MKVENVTIIGLGLIGGSFGMALKRTNPELNICGVDIDSNTIKLGIETKAIDWGTSNVIEGVKQADLIIVATHISTIIKITKEMTPYLKPGSIVTDVGSTKGYITEIMSSTLPSNVHYIGGHPMAGSEIKGIIGADSYLFENAVYILTPLETTNEKALSTFRNLIEAIGSRVLEISPQEHDFMVGAISHLPHIVAATLVNSIGCLEDNKQQGIFKLAAGGFRDVTRIADSQPQMWRDIFLQNREAILPIIKVFRQSLDQIEQAIYQEEGEKIELIMNNAKELRQQIPAKIKGLLPEIYEIVVTAPDEPGIIGKIANILGEENINIMDIEILRVREGDGGTIRLGFQKREMTQRAVIILRNNGFIAKVKN